MLRAWMIAIGMSALLAVTLQGWRTAAPSHGTASRGTASDETVSQGTTAPKAENPSLTSAPASEWDLALAFLEALKVRDAAAMQKFIIDEKTFREVVYPTMPYHDPARPHVADFNWGFIRANTLTGIQKVLASHGGLEAELTDIVPLGKVEERKGYKLLPDMDLKLRTREGREIVLDVLGSMVETEDGVKLMGFRD